MAPGNRSVRRGIAKVRRELQGSVFETPKSKHGRGIDNDMDVAGTSVTPEKTLSTTGSRRRDTVRDGTHGSGKLVLNECRWLRRAITVGTDFSGLEMPIIALEKLQIPFRHLFSCDSDLHCRKLIQGRFKPAAVYKNILDDDGDRASVDLYVFCAPCVTFSSEGNGEGDETLIKAACMYIRKSRPRIIVSENVVGITFKKHARILRKLRATLSPHYVMFTRILNSADYGVCQQRRRWYLVAIRRDCYQADFRWPRASKSGKPDIEACLDAPTRREFWKRLPDKSGKDNRRRELVKTAFRKLKAAKLHPAANPTFVDTGCSLSRAHHRTNEMCTMTRTRCAAFDYWVTSRGRPLTLREMTRFQGAELEDFGDLDKYGISKTQFAGMLGNSVTLTVMMHVLKAAIASTRFD